MSGRPDFSATDRGCELFPDFDIFLGELLGDFRAVSLVGCRRRGEATSVACSTLVVATS